MLTLSIPQFPINFNYVEYHKCFALHKYANLEPNVFANQLFVPSNFFI